MRLASYELRGKASFGVATEAGLIDLPPRLRGLGDLRAVLEAPDGLARAGQFTGDAADVALEAVAFLPVIPRPNKIIGIGLNYRDHAAELGSALPGHPDVFIRWPSAQVGHLRPITKPRISDRFDFEGELAVIIGRPGRHIPPERAIDHVAGYSCFNDATVRDWQRHTSQFAPGKNFDGSGAIGPWLTTKDEVPNPGRLSVRTTLNGERVQDGGTADMIFDIAALIAYITTFTELRPGDVIATGTPKGVGDGRKPPLYLRAGDTVEVAIGGVGTLRNSVVDEA